MSQTYGKAVLDEMEHGVRSLLDEWELPSDSEVSLLNISENATFIAASPYSGEKVIIRVHRPDYHTKQEIESELIWVNSLKDQGIVSTASPLPLSSGEKIAVLNNGTTQRLAVGFEYLNGNEPAPENDLRDNFYTLGEITAKLHAHSKVWAIPIGFKRKVWDFDSMLGSRPLWGDWRDAIGLDHSGRKILKRTVERLCRQLEGYGKSRQRFGLIHADLRLANLLVDQEKLSVIDFDDCGYSWFMYDFAAAISFMEEDRQIPELLESWIQGYRSQAPLAEEDEAAIPMFIMLRRILLTAWLASHSETETAKELGSGYTLGTVRMAQSYLETNSPI